MTRAELRAEIIKDLALFQHDPVRFVRWAFPWGEGDLADREPDDWQLDILKAVGDGTLKIGEAVQIAVCSGHGIGKSALVSWLILWALSTHENTRGVVTANTEAQLKSKTWAELGKWYARFIAKELFVYTATAIYVNEKTVDAQKQWRIDAVAWSEHNTEAFAGLHNQGNRILVIFDEASAISDKIWEVTEGALTDADTEIIWFCPGNPTRNTGRFYECFNRYRHRWITKQIDSRTVKITNKKQMQKWVDDNGEDSDFVKIRVRGVFPSSSALQFIGSDLIDAARGRVIVESQYSFAPKIIGVDPAYSGDDEFAVYMRQGLAAQLLGTFRKLEDDMKAAGKIAQWEDEHKADAVFVDMGYGTGIVSAGRAMGRNWVLVPFGGGSGKEGYLNKRAEIWGDVKAWLREGGCIPDDPVLAAELAGPEGYVNLKGLIQLESKDDMKRRGVPSPNRADALALTFAFPVQAKSAMRRTEFVSVPQNWDPLAF